MADEIVRERVLWHGQLCTVLEKKLGRYKLRDSFGFVEDNVPKREVTKLRADDERAKFTLRSE